KPMSSSFQHMCLDALRMKGRVEGLEKPVDVLRELAVPAQEYCRFGRVEQVSDLSRAQAVLRRRISERRNDADSEPGSYICLDDVRTQGLEYNAHVDPGLLKLAQ